MADVTVVVLVVGAIVTALVVGFVLLVQVQRVKRAYGEATRVVDRMKPLLDELTQQQHVTSRELARVGDAVDVLGQQRKARRRA